MVFNFFTVLFVFKGCVDDIVTVLAEEHGCLDIIKVCGTSLLFYAILSKTFFYFIYLLLFFYNYHQSSTGTRFQIYLLTY